MFVGKGSTRLGERECDVYTAEVERVALEPRVNFTNQGPVLTTTAPMKDPYQEPMAARSVSFSHLRIQAQI